MRKFVNDLLVIDPEKRPSFNEMGEYTIFNEMDQLKAEFDKLMDDQENYSRKNLEKV